MVDHPNQTNKDKSGLGSKSTTPSRTAISSTITAPGSAGSSSLLDGSKNFLPPHEIAQVFVRMPMPQTSSTASTDAVCGCSVPFAALEFGRTSTTTAATPANQNKIIHSSSSTTTTLRCPKCGTSIGYIRDALVSKDRPTVLFKYQKYIVELTILNTPSTASTSTSSTATTTTSYWGWGWPIHVLMSWLGFDASTSDRVFGVPTHYLDTTAQGRIVTALQLQSLKILCKGKVLYPSTTCSEEQISQQLIELSHQQQSSPKVSLLVMGTPQSSSLSMRSSMDSTKPSFSWTDMAFTLFQHIVHWSYHVVVTAISWTRDAIVRPIYQALLPTSSTTSANGTSSAAS